jgi:hydroxymethylbilane synthase
MRLRIGTRGSALAQTQAAAVGRALRARDPSITIDMVELSTAGDDEPEAPLERLEGVGWFTSTLERALAEGRIDLAVHSYKDLPVDDAYGLHIAATLERGPVEDVLCARHNARLETLPLGARVGTSSLRRLAQLRRMRPDLCYVSLRGNVPTRLERVKRGELDGVVLARAGLERLGLMNQVSEVFPVSRLFPAPGQGALAIQTRADDREVTAHAAALDHRATHHAVRAERLVLRALRGGCSVPVGVCARPVGNRFRLMAAVFSLTSTDMLEVILNGPDPETLGRDAASRLVEAGALRLLHPTGSATPAAARR